jgi:Cytochrome P460
MRYGLSLLFVVAALLAGCLPDPTPLAPTPDAPITVDESALLSVLPHHGSELAFARLNAEPYVTALESQDLVNVWISRQAFSEYQVIAPELSDSGVEVPEGTLIVREVLDDAGAVKTLTLMYKGPPGYNPEIGDWWWGVTDGQGQPTKMGKLEECYSCHLDRAGDDFLFGVPRAERR